MNIELANPDDWSDIREVFRNAGAAAWSEIFAADALEALEPPERLRGSIGHSGRSGEIWVARFNGKVRGFIAIRASGDSGAKEETGEVDSFYTDPSVWGMGVGRGLMEIATQRLAEMGFELATLWTEKRNRRARAFYSEAGWALDGTSRQRTIHGALLVEDRYRRDLSAENERETQ